MKPIILLLILSVLLSCGSGNQQESQTASASTGAGDSASVTYPLPTFYSPSWEVGDPKHVVTVMNIGKNWMERNFNSFDGVFADTVSLYFANGDQVIASRDSTISLMKTLRNMYTEVSAQVHNAIAIHHRDTKEDWVCIWLKEITSSMQGKKDSVELQESWRLNKDGKVELVYQYAAAIKPVKK